MSENINSNNVPDSISMEDLIALSSSAKEDEAAQKLNGPFQGMSKEQVIELCSDAEQTLTEQCPHPMATKQMIQNCLERLLLWHMGSAERRMEEGEFQSAGGWARDAGKIQAAWNILSTIEVCDEDFLMD